jgi:hypothetical protein
MVPKLISSPRLPGFVPMVPKLISSPRVPSFGLVYLDLPVLAMLLGALFDLKELIECYLALVEC